MIDRREFLRRLSAAGIAVTMPGLAGCFGSGAAAGRPNFLIFLADDLGYGDLASYGNPIIETPNLDAFAAQGIRFTDFHSGGTVCSPSRAALLTGRNPYRSGFYYIAGSGMHLRREETTIASLLREAGYDTCFVGKWHLSRFDREAATAPNPGDHGFDHWFATAVNAFEGPQNPNTFYRNGVAVGEVDGWYCDVIVEEALAWLAARPDPDRPFFLEICSHEPHTPVAPPTAYADRYDSARVDSLEGTLRYGDVARPDHDISQNKRYYYGTVDQLDDAFGRLIEGLDAAGEGDDTLVVFTSDNGPESPVNQEESRGEWDDPSRDRAFGTPGPWRGMKRFPYEGGHRVPGIVRWPGVVPPGRVSDALVNGTDLLPTLAALAGIPLPDGLKLDGMDVTPAFRGSGLSRTEPVYWFFPAHEDTYYRMPHVAMRDGDWTLLAWLRPKDPEQKIMDWLKTAPFDRFALYDLAADPGQVDDRWSADSARGLDMAAKMQAFWEDVRADGPYWESWTMK